MRGVPGHFLHSGKAWGASRVPNGCTLGGDVTRGALAVLLFASLAASGCLDFSKGYDKRPVREDRGPLLADDVVLSFGADFLETWISPIDYARGFVAKGAKTVIPFHFSPRYEGRSAEVSAPGVW